MNTIGERMRTLREGMKLPQKKTLGTLFGVKYKVITTTKRRQQQ